MIYAFLCLLMSSVQALQRLFAASVASSSVTTSYVTTVSAATVSATTTSVTHLHQPAAAPRLSLLEVQKQSSAPMHYLQHFIIRSISSSEAFHSHLKHFITTSPPLPSPPPDHGVPVCVSAVSPCRMWRNAGDVCI